MQFTRNIKFLLLFSAAVTSTSASSQIDSLKQVLERCKVDSTAIRLNLDLSWAFMTTNNDSAYMYADRANKMAAAVGDTVSLAKSHNYFGIIQFRRGNLAKSIREYKTALPLFESAKDVSGAAACVNNIGNIYSEFGNRQASIEHYKHFVKLAKSIDNFEKMAKGYFNIALTYIEDGQSDSARYYIDVFEKFQKDKGQEYLSSDILKAILYQMEKDYDKVLYHSDRWLKSGKLDDLDKIEYYIMRTQGFHGKKDYKSALVYALIGEEMCTRIVATADLLRIRRLKADILNHLGESRKAYDELNDYVMISDSLQEENGVIQLGEIFKEYEQVVWEKEMLEKEQVFKEQEERSRNVVFVLIFTAFFIAIVAGLSIYFSLKNKKQNILLNAKNKEISEQRGKVLASIRYAEKIQNAILKPDSFFKKEFPDSFVYNKPRDIVSGDFYWAGRVREFVYLAVVDCTGHGVPGAMMSMVGHGILTTIISEGKIMQPSEILTELNNQVTSGLNQNSDNSMVQDGMDISLVRIDRANRKLIFAGACQSLVVMNSSNYSEYKGCPSSIGGAESETKMKFDQTELTYSDKSVVFMYTDGFQDQFGGKEGKKFGKNLFMELLIDIGQSDLSEAENKLSGTHKKWSKHEKQIDDMLVLGFRL